MDVGTTGKSKVPLSDKETSPISILSLRSPSTSPSSSMISCPGLQSPEQCPVNSAYCQIGGTSAWNGNSEKRSILERRAPPGPQLFFSGPQDGTSFNYANEGTSTVYLPTEHVADENKELRRNWSEVSAVKKQQRNVDGSSAQSSLLLAGQYAEPVIRRDEAGKGLNSWGYFGDPELDQQFLEQVLCGNGTASLGSSTATSELEDLESMLLVAPSSAEASVDPSLKTWLISGKSVLTEPSTIEPARRVDRVDVGNYDMAYTSGSQPLWSSNVEEQNWSSVQSTGTTIMTQSLPSNDTRFAPVGLQKSGLIHGVRPEAFLDLLMQEVENSNALNLFSCHSPSPYPSQSLPSSTCILCNVQEDSIQALPKTSSDFNSHSPNWSVPSSSRNVLSRVGSMRNDSTRMSPFPALCPAPCLPTLPQGVSFNAASLKTARAHGPGLPIPFTPSSPVSHHGPFLQSGSCLFSAAPASLLLPATPHPSIMRCRAPPSPGNSILNLEPSILPSFEVWPGEKSDDCIPSRHLSGIVPEVPTSLNYPRSLTTVPLIADPHLPAGGKLLTSTSLEECSQLRPVSHGGQLGKSPSFQSCRTKNEPWLTLQCPSHDPVPVKRTRSSFPSRRRGQIRSNPQLVDACDPSAKNSSAVQGNGVKAINLLLEAAVEVSRANMENAQQILVQVSQLVLPRGENSLHRVSFYFMEALMSKISGQPSPFTMKTTYSPHDIFQKVRASKKFCEVSPLPQFSFFTSNQTILEAMEGEELIHVIDFEVGLGVQWASFLHDIAARLVGTDKPPSLRLTVLGSATREAHCTGESLCQLAKDLDLSFDFRLVSCPPQHLTVSSLDLRKGEAVAVNFVLSLHTLLLEKSSESLNAVLRVVRQIWPKVVTVVELEANHNLSLFHERFTEALQYYTFLFDSLNRGVDESDHCSRDEIMAIEKVLLAPQILNIVTCEGNDRIRRHEKLRLWRNRFTAAGFHVLDLSARNTTQVEYILSRLKAWSRDYQIVRDEGSLFLSWQKRPLMAASAWRC